MGLRGEIVRSIMASQLEFRRQDAIITALQRFGLKIKINMVQLSGREHWHDKLPIGRSLRNMDEWRTNSTKSTSIRSRRKRSMLTLTKNCVIKANSPSHTYLSAFKSCPSARGRTVSMNETLIKMQLAIVLQWECRELMKCRTKFST